MAADDSRGLFSAGPASQAPSSVAGEPSGRRTKLYFYDSVASQMLNPWGESNFTQESTEAVWRAAAQGTKKVAFHTELADEEKYRQGVGLSRTAEALLAAIAVLESKNMTKLLQQGPLEAARNEAAELKPHLTLLNRGKGRQEGPKEFTMSQLKKRRVDSGASAPPSEEAVKAAAVEVHKWLSKETTPLRAILTILAGNGTFWAGHVAEKTCRAAVQHKPFTEVTFAAAAAARNTAPAPSVAAQSTAADTGGLFDS